MWRGLRSCGRPPELWARLHRRPQNVARPPELRRPPEASECGEASGAVGSPVKGPPEVGLAGITKKPAPAGFLLDIQFSNPKFAQICYFFDPCFMAVVVAHVVDCVEFGLIRTKRKNVVSYSDYWDIFSIKIDVM